MRGKNLYLCLGNVYNFQTYIPIINAAKKQQINCFLVLFVDHPGRKLKTFPAVHPIRHQEYIKNLCNSLGITFLIDEPKNLDLNGDIIFTERRGLNNLQSHHNVKIHILTRLLDFINPNWYSYYHAQAKNIFFTSKHIAINYGKHTEKNRYIGSPKYDTNFVKEDIIKKLNLDPKHKYITVIYPDDQFRPRFKLDSLIEKITQSGYFALVKGRDSNSGFNKDRVINNCKLIHDDYFFPNPTMDLISISDMVFNFNSTAVEECVFLETPFINFSDRAPPMYCIYDPSYALNLPLDFEIENIHSVVDSFLKSDFKSNIRQAKLKWFKEIHNSSEKLLQIIFNEEA